MIGFPEIEALVPWRRPFLFVDRVVEWRPHDSIVTSKRVSAGDPLGGACGALAPVLLLEGLSQSAAVLYRLSYGDAAATLPLLGFLRATLGERPVLPGETVRFRVGAVKMTLSGGVFEGRADVEGDEVASADLAFGTVPRREAT